VDELIDWVEDVPLLVVATARPELVDRRSNWGGGKRNAVTISLAPLADDETARLLAALLDRSVLPAEQQQALLARAGGNPLYAEQFARMFAERGDTDAALPETVQGIIAARLDSLPRAEKFLVLNASVLGKTFWRGALVGEDVDGHLHALQRKEFIRRERRSSVEGENEFSFAHLLIRDVAYSQIPRAERAAEHARAARWIESLSGDRADDLAELRAHHYVAALDLIEAAGGDVSELVDHALDALIAAAHRASRLFAFAQVERYASRALALVSPDDPRRPSALAVLATAEAELGKLEFVEHAAEAAQAFAARGEHEAAAEAETLAANWLWNFGDRDGAHAAVRRALDLVGDAGPSQGKAAALTAYARLLMLGARYPESIEFGTRALEVARDVGDEGLEASVLITIGTARNTLGDDGFGDLEQGIAIADRLNIPREYTRGHNNVGEELMEHGDLSGAEERYRLALERMEQFGIIQSIAWLLPQQAQLAYSRGNWAAAEDAVRRYYELLETMSGHYLEVQAETVRALIAGARSEAGAEGLWQSATNRGRTVKDPQALAPTLSGSARFLLELGRRDEADALVDEYFAQHAHHYTALIDIAWLLRDLARPETIAGGGIWGAAGRLILRDEFESAADLLAEKGLHTDEAYARLRVAEQLASEGRGAEAQPQLERALAFYRTVGAASYVRRGEALLRASA
jgi:tetratricopeptide (TPR) repeat protein